MMMWTPIRAATLICAAVLAADAHGMAVPVASAANRAAPSTAEPGPRGPVGPDVPLTPKETAMFARGVTVKGFTTGAVQTACNEARKSGLRTVYLPEGRYTLSNVTIPGGITLLGAGPQTHISTVKNGTIFRIGGDNIRITRLKLDGGNPTPANVSESRCFYAKGKKNIRIDHCEVTAFARGPGFSGAAIGQMDHCITHHNCWSGLGYGVISTSGARVLVCDNIFHSNRHTVTSNYGNPHYTFRHNHITGDKDCARGDNLSQCDVHSRAPEGTFVIEYNIFENLKGAIGAWSSQGLVRGNVFRRVGYAIHITGKRDHEIQANNRFEKVRSKYKGVVSGPTKAARPLKIPYMKEMNTAGVIEVIEGDTTPYYTQPHPCCPRPAKPTKPRASRVAAARRRAGYAKVATTVISKEKLAPWKAKLRSWIQKRLAAGFHPRAYLKLFGVKAEAVKIMAANAKELSIRLKGGTLPLRWSRLSDADYLGLARAFFKDGAANDHLLLAVFLVANGKRAAAEDHFAQAALADSTKAVAVKRARQSLK